MVPLITGSKQTTVQNASLTWGSVCSRCLPFSVFLRVTVHIFIWGTLKNTAVVGLELTFMGHRRAENKRQGDWWIFKVNFLC